MPLAKVLFIGTNEQKAKVAPLKGLEPPIFLTDVYPAFFCKQDCTNGERWGILSVCLTDLYADKLAPSPSYIKKYTKTNKTAEQILNEIERYKSKWEKSLSGCGVCVYNLPIPPKAIQRIMIYSCAGRETNATINRLINELPEPHSVSPATHKALYHKSLGLSRWFNGEEVRCEDIYNGETNIKLVNELDGSLTNRLGLDMYYLKSEEKKRGKKIES